MSNKTQLPRPIAPELFRRRVFSGNPPHAPRIMGFVVQFHELSPIGLTRQRRATAEEKTWLKVHGYVFSGGRWCRADRQPARAAQPDWDPSAWRARRKQRINEIVVLSTPMKDILRDMLQMENRDVSRELGRGFEVLILELQRAQADLTAGRRINPLLLQHTADISQQIGRWNLALIILPGVSTAQSGAETAQSGAETAQSGAETAQSGAETAQSGAETAQSGAETDNLKTSLSKEP